MSKFKKETTICIESTQKKKLKVNNFVILSMFVTFFSLVVFLIMIGYQVIKYRTFTEQLKWQLPIFLIFALYAVCSEFIYQWKENFKFIVKYNSFGKIENIRFTYDILPIFTNKNTAVLDLKRVNYVNMERNKLIIHGKMIETLPMQKQRHYGTITVKKSEFNLNELYKYLRKFQKLA